MPIEFPVVPGTVLLCNYDTGFREPEMVKRRPVVVVSPRLPHRNFLCTVVPLSTTAPMRLVSYVHKLSLLQALPDPFSGVEMWAKADMMATVSFRRLDLFRTARDQAGRRRYLHPKVSAEDLALIRQAMLYALGIVGKEASPHLREKD